MDAEAIKQSLEGSGLRCTAQRYAVMAFLMDHKGHPTAAEIFEAVNRVDPRSSRATTYNNLRDLVKAGLVREVAVEGRAGRFDAGRHAPPPLHLRPLRQRGGRGVVRRAQACLALSRQANCSRMRAYFSGLCTKCARATLRDDSICQNSDASVSR